MEVICPSFGRTGTRSTQLALEILGFGPCYHMFQVVQEHVSTHPQLWIDAYEGRGLQVAKIFESYRSVTDWPASDFYKEIMEEYPEAKVVLTIRDVDSWWKSLIGSVHNKAPGFQQWGWFFMRAIIPRYQTFYDMLHHVSTLNMGEEDAKADFLRHQEEVKAHVPADKLLIFSLKDGWEPLCDFLGVPVPDVPFPRANSTQEMTERKDKRNKAGWMVLAITIASGGLVAGAAFRAGGQRAGRAVIAVELCAFALSLVKAR